MTSTDLMAGSDYDGDEFVVIAEPQLVANFAEAEAWDAPPPPPSGVPGVKAANPNPNPNPNHDPDPNPSPNPSSNPNPNPNPNPDPNPYPYPNPNKAAADVARHDAPEQLQRQLALAYLERVRA